MAGRIVNRVQALFGVFGAVALVVSYFLVTGQNPVPGLLDSLGKVGTLSRPQPRWTVMVGDQPDGAVTAPGVVIVVAGGAVEGHDVGNGGRLWRGEARWSALAGEDSASVLLLGRGGTRMDAVDPRTGGTRWSDAAVVGVWPFRTAVLTVGCPGSGDCVVAARNPADGAVRWRATVPGLRRSGAGSVGHLRGTADAPLLGTRDTSAAFDTAVAAVPAELPAVLAVQVGRRAEIIDTAIGKRLAPVQLGADRRVAAVNGKVLVTRASTHGSGCEYSIEALDPATGAVTWRVSGLDPHTVSGSGCQQRRAPTGGTDALVVTRSDGRPALLSTVTGTQVWVGEPGDSVRAVGARYALVRTADKTKLRSVAASTGAVRATWPLPSRATVAVCGGTALVHATGTGGLAGYDPGSGRRLLDATVVGEIRACGPVGVVLSRGRRVGLVPVSGAP